MFKMPKSASKIISLRSKIDKSKMKAKKLDRLKVLKMLAVMANPKAGTSSNNSVEQDQSGNGNSKEFLATGRTGRRNALPDVFGENALVTSSDLPDKFKKLATNENSPETSKNDNKPEQSGPSGSK